MNLQGGEIKQCPALYREAQHSGQTEVIRHKSLYFLA